MKNVAFAALLLAGMAGVARADVILQEDFDDVASLAEQDWVFANRSAPPGPTARWDQGNPAVFAAHRGAGESYVASNYLAAGAGGTLENWLITPAFSTAQDLTISFYLRAEAFPGFFDEIRFGFSQGGSALDDFTLATPVVVPTKGWTRFTLQLAAQGADSMARLAFVHAGPADRSDYIGLDTLRVRDNAVPEPGSVLLLGLGLAGLAARRRR